MISYALDAYKRLPLEKHFRVHIRNVQVQHGNTVAHMGPHNKNAPQNCEASGAENETRTITCNILIVNDLVETEKTSGEA